MGYNNNVSNYGECVKIGSFAYALEEDADLHLFERFPKEQLSNYAIFDKALEENEVFYVTMDDYLNNIIYNRLRGHEMFLKKSNSGNIIEVYSLNYKRVMKQDEIMEVKKR